MLIKICHLGEGFHASLVGTLEWFLSRVDSQMLAKIRPFVMDFRTAYVSALKNLRKSISVGVSEFVYPELI